MNFINKSKVKIDNRVLVYNDLFYERIFEYWGNEKINIKTEIEIEAVKPEHEVEEVIWNTYKKFLMAGKSTKEKQK